MLYMLGGGVMVLRGLKNETVDLDFIVDDYESAEIVTKCFKKLGFRERLAGARFERQRDGVAERVEIDIGGFLGVPLTNDARSRAEPRKFGNLEIKLLANEDVFLFKSVTGRYKDVGDLSSLISAGINWDTVCDEARRLRGIGVQKVSPGVVAVTLRYLRVNEKIIKKFTLADQQKKEVDLRTSG